MKYWILLREWWKNLSRIGIKGSRFLNHESISWSREPKSCKISIFDELLFTKYDNFSLISADDICLSELHKWRWMMKEQNSVDRMVWIVFSFVIFFLIPTLLNLLLEGKGQKTSHKKHYCNITKNLLLLLNSSSSKTYPISWKLS